MSFPRYPKYKDSGVEWLGEVPEHWEVKPLKAVCQLFGRIGYRGYTTADIVDEGEGAITLSPSNMVDGALSLEKSTFISWEKYNESPEIMVCPHDIVMVKTGSSFGKVAYVSLVDHPMTINPQLVLYRNFTCAPRFLFFALAGAHIQARISVNNTGSSIPTMSQETIGNFRFGLPPLPEQTAIAAFLDRETAKIDALVAEQRRLIELLKEKRQAVISHAVTKGLNPDAPLKPSGIEWLGDVPEHWVTMPIRYAARLESGHTPSRSRPEWWVDCKYPWISLSDVWQIRDGVSKYIHETKEKVSELGLANSAARLLPKRTVVLSRTASVGFAGIMGDAMATTQDFANWVCGPCLVPEYLLFVFRSMSGEFERLKYGSTHNTIYMPDISAMRFALPPKAEQEAIVKHIDVELDGFNTFIAEAQRAIDLLQERRTALISAAVTGQIDVRSLATTEGA